MPHVTVAQKFPSVKATKFDIKGDSSSAITITTSHHVLYSHQRTRYNNAAWLVNE